MKRWLPQTLAGQLLSLLLLGLFVSHIAFHLASGKTDGQIHKLSQDQIVEQLATTRRIFSSCRQPCDSAPLLAALESEFATFSLTSAPLPEPRTEEESAIVLALGRLLAMPVSIVINEDDPRAGSRITRTLSVTAIMSLENGRALQGKIWPVVRRSAWRPVGLTIMASAIPVLLLVSLFARHLLKPMRFLARAAERISRGERVTVPEHGPQEVREVAVAFNAMQEKLAHHVAERTRMLAAISHDLRTPITSLRLRVEMIDDAGLRSAMIRTLEEMRQMVEETLVFTRNDSLRENTDVIDLAELIRKTGEEQQALGGAVRWSDLPPLPYRARPLAMKRALSNLIENALRYGGSAEISLHQAAEIEIHIEDRGPGLAEAWLEKVFEPFARPSQDRCHDTGGVGLGLSIARSAIEAHGGRIELANREGGGLRASVFLPLQTR